MASANAGTINVCQSGCDYSSLHEAVNVASEGDTISVQSGTYPETVNLSKRLILRGVDTGSGKPLLTNSSSIITVSANRSIIAGFNLTGSKEAGIKILSWGNTILENDLGLNAIGISVQSGENIITKNNILKGNLGVAVTDSSENTLTFNNISDNHLGLILNSSSANDVRENTMSQSAGYGIILKGSNFNTLIGNTVRNNARGIFLNESDNNSLFRNNITENSLVDVHDSGLNCWEGNRLGTSNIRTDNGSCNEEPGLQEGSIPALYSNPCIRSDAESDAKSISPGDAYSLIQNSSCLKMIDVRTPQEYQSGHLDGAINLDYYSYGFLDSLKSLDKNRTYIVYCRRGVRGEVALEMMRALGFREVHNILGGLTQWSQEGRPMMGELI